MLNKKRRHDRMITYMWEYGW